MRVALVHYWLVGMRGGERVFEQFCKMFPQADVFTHVLKRQAISDTILKHRIETTFINKLPLADRLYPKYLPFMPRALEELDLSQYDLIVSSESGPAKGVIARPGARHVCYCHTPMRYVWDHYHNYQKQLNGPAKMVFRRVAHSIRQWDVTSAARVDAFVANSTFVADRIVRYYRREAEIVHPPVALDCFVPRSRFVASAEDYYLVVSELVPYKRVDLAIEAFRRLNRPLVIVGDGPAAKVLKHNAPPNVRFVGRVSRDRLASYYANARALVFSGEEDFGLVPVECMACGRPVIAYRSGGALDTVSEYVSGLFFRQQTPEALSAAIVEFENIEAQFDPVAIRRHAENFSEERFRAAFAHVVEREMEGTRVVRRPAFLSRERVGRDIQAAVQVEASAGT